MATRHRSIYIQKVSNDEFKVEEISEFGYNESVFDNTGAKSMKVPQVDKYTLNKLVIRTINN